MKGVLAWACVLGMLTAGCIASEGATAPKGATVSGGAPVANGPATFDENTGGLQGTVVDTEAQPVPGALVGVLQLSLQVSTDAQGTFSFSNLAPGTYALQATALGFTDASRSVEVKAGEVASATLIIDRISVKVAYHASYPLKGYFECSYQAGNKGPCFYPFVGTNTSTVNVDPWTNNKRQFDYGVGPGAMTVLNEMSWTRTTAATGSAMSVFMSYAKRTGSHWYCDAASPSPVYMRWDRNITDPEKGDGTCLKGDAQLAKGEPNTIPMEGQILTSRANTGPSDLPGVSATGVGMAVQQSFELMLSIWYWDHAPDAWSGLAD